MEGQARAGSRWIFVKLNSCEQIAGARPKLAERTCSSAISTRPNKYAKPSRNIRLRSNSIRSCRRYYRLGRLTFVLAKGPCPGAVQCISGSRTALADLDKQRAEIRQFVYSRRIPPPQTVSLRVARRGPKKVSARLTDVLTPIRPRRFYGSVGVEES